MSANEKRFLAAMGAQAGAFAVVLAFGGLARLGTVPSPAPMPAVTVTRTYTQPPVTITKTKYAQPSPTHHRKSSRVKPASPVVRPDPAPDITPGQASANPASSAAASGGHG